MDNLRRDEIKMKNSKKKKKKLYIYKNKDDK